MMHARPADGAERRVSVSRVCDACLLSTTLDLKCAAPATSSPPRRRRLSSAVCRLPSVGRRLVLFTLRSSLSLCIAVLWALYLSVSLSLFLRLTPFYPDVRHQTQPHSAPLHSTPLPFPGLSLVAAHNLGVARRLPARRGQHTLDAQCGEARLDRVVGHGRHGG